MALVTLRYESESGYYFSSIKNIKLSAVVIMFLTLAVIYSNPASYPYICMTAVPLLILQVFSSLNYYNYIRSNKLSYSNKNKIKTRNFNFPFVFAAGLAVREGFFLIFICFDIIWLLGAYITPDTADSFTEYVSRLNIGFITGRAFLIFTIFFWLIYTILFFIGSAVKKELIDENLTEVKKDRRLDFTLEVNTFSNKRINLSGYRIPNPSGQPLILYPGFFQNGFFYDLSPPHISAAEFLWDKGYDIWIFHPRGTATSGFAEVINSMDDYASDDLPSIIDFVLFNTGKKPVLIGHSQGGISSIISLMGASKTSEGIIKISEEEGIKRQEKLKGLVTLGSYLNFSFSKHSALQNFVREGFTIHLFGKKRKIVSSEFLLSLLNIFNRVPVPIPFSLRIILLKNKPLRIILFPLTLLLNLISTLGVWQFLYNIPNVNKESRKFLFYKTIDATFRGILSQFHNAIKTEGMCSYDKKICYSDYYSNIKLPVSVVTMEDDTLADPAETKKIMFAGLGSKQKYFTEWKGQGHEDFVMNPAYFNQLLKAIELLIK